MRLGSIRRLARLLLIAAPPLLIGFLIFRDGVDTPFWDEWDRTAPLFEKMAAGTLGFADFFAQHNEHRILFPRLIFFGLTMPKPVGPIALREAQPLVSGSGA
jgi:hypothetical protein